MLHCEQENIAKQECGGCSALPGGCSRDSPLCLSGGEGSKINPFWLFRSQTIQDLENPSPGFTLKSSLAACTRFKVAHFLHLFSQGAVSCAMEKCICTSLPSWAPPHPSLSFALPLKHRNASVYIWAPLGMDPFRGEAKDVFLGASVLRNGYLHLVIIIVFSNKTSGRKKISYSSKMG